MITPEQAESISDVELAFSTERFLPAWADIPDELKNPASLYVRVAEAIVLGAQLPDCTVRIHEGFTPELVNRVTRAHAQSFAPKHQHKVAGVACLISQMATLEPS